MERARQASTSKSHRSAPRTQITRENRRSRLKGPLLDGCHLGRERFLSENGMGFIRFPGVDLDREYKLRAPLINPKTRILCFIDSLPMYVLLFSSL